MTPFKINPNSWHFRVANWVNDGDYGRGMMPDDFCTYARNVFYGLAFGTFLAAIALFLIGIVVALFVGAGLWVYDSIVAGHLAKLTPPAIIFMVLSFIVLLVWGLALFSAWNRRRKQNTRKHSYIKEYKEPGFISTWYETNRGKFCLPIVMKDD